MRKAAPTKAVLTLVAAMALAAQAMARETPIASPQDALQLEAAQSAEAVSQAPAASPADGAFQVIRPGDSQMSCEALIAEANALNAQMTAAQNALSERAIEMSRSQLQGMQAQMAASSAMSLGSMAASFIPGAGLALGAAQSIAGVAQRAAAAAQEQQRMSAMDDMMADVEASTGQLMPLMSRADHLTDLSIAKRC